jgi:hypothetical protein
VRCGVAEQGVLEHLAKRRAAMRVAERLADQAEPYRIAMRELADGISSNDLEAPCGSVAAALRGVAGRRATAPRQPSRRAAGSAAGCSDLLGLRPGEAPSLHRSGSAGPPLHGSRRRTQDTSSARKKLRGGPTGTRRGPSGSNRRAGTVLASATTNSPSPRSRELSRHPSSTRASATDAQAPRPLCRRDARGAGRARRR